MAGKIILCRCEDVTLDELGHALELGYRHIEEVKRYTGFGTGPCQGKECLALCALYLAERLDVAVESVPPFTARPPLAAVSLGTLAAGATVEEEES